MGIIVLTAMFLSLSAGQTAPDNSPVPIVEVEACTIQANSMAAHGRWGGQVAFYDAESDNSGKLINLKRRIIEGREHLPKLVRLEQFEKCVSKWKFDGAGVFTITLIGGTVTEGGLWTIDVRQGSRRFRVRVPVAIGQ